MNHQLVKGEHRLKRSQHASDKASPRGRGSPSVSTLSTNSLGCWLRSMIKLAIDAPAASRTAQLVQVLESDIEIQTLWYMANRTSRRAAGNDHGAGDVRTALH